MGNDFNFWTYIPEGDAFFSKWKVQWQMTYPEGYKEVINGEGYWYPAPIEILGYYGKFGELGSYRIYDIDHPRCYYCGKFIKKGDWWKAEGWTGPCTDCYENTRWL